MSTEAGQKALRPAIIFDWDGTLANSMPLCIVEMRSTFERMGLPQRSDAEYRKCNGPSVPESVAVMNIPPERADEFVRIREEEEVSLAPTEQRLFPGIREMLERLHPVADLHVVSKGRWQYLNASIDATGIRPLLGRIRSARDFPSKDCALGLMLSQIAYSRAVIVGDHTGDIEAGKAVGILTVAAGFGFGTPEEYAQADACAPTVEALSDLLMHFAQTGELKTE